MGPRVGFRKNGLHSLLTIPQSGTQLVSCPQGGPLAVLTPSPPLRTHAIIHSLSGQGNSLSQIYAHLILG